jgi:hypothetical protein
MQMLGGLLPRIGRQVGVGMGEGTAG